MFAVLKVFVAVHMAIVGLVQNIALHIIVSLVMGFASQVSQNDDYNST